MKSQEESDIEKRLLVAILLSMAILFVTPYIYERFYPQPELPPEEQTLAESIEETGEPTVPSEASLAEPDLSQTTEEEEEEVVEATEAEARTISIENRDVILRISNVGAVFTSIQLKEFGSSTNGGDQLNGALELLPQGLPDSFPRPLGIHLADEILRTRLAESAFEVDGAGTDSVRAPATLTFRYRDSEIQVEKRIEVPEEGFQLRVTTQVIRAGRSVPHGIALGAGIGETARVDVNDFRDPSISYYVGGAVERFYEGDLDEGVVSLEGAARWVGLDSKYFTLLIFEPGVIRNIRMERLEWTSGEAEVAEVVPLVSGVVGVAPGATFRFYVGPKSQDELKALDPTATSLIDYGWFTILVKPLVLGLRWVHGYVGNWGWAIIILTFLINLALFPIRYKQMASMQKMSALQPKLKSIQDRYKRMKRDDPRKQQMNTEVMALYKEHGVNPLGGCLPLLLQMPILFAFYQMLNASIELRGAPFMLWIQDLSEPDPYYITPIVMGLTMVLQQKMTPATGDPAQRRMMMFLPIVFTFFFLSVSSGLAIYFLFSNVFAMMLQLALKRFQPSAVPLPVKGKKGKSKK